MSHNDENKLQSLDNEEFIKFLRPFYLVNSAGDQHQGSDIKIEVIRRLRLQGQQGSQEKPKITTTLNVDDLANPFGSPTLDDLERSVRRHVIALGLRDEAFVAHVMGQLTKISLFADRETFALVHATMSVEIQISDDGTVNVNAEKRKASEYPPSVFGHQLQTNPSHSHRTSHPGSAPMHSPTHPPLHSGYVHPEYSRLGSAFGHSQTELSAQHLGPYLNPIAPAGFVPTFGGIRYHIFTVGDLFEVGGVDRKPMGTMADLSPAHAALLTPEAHLAIANSLHKQHPDGKFVEVLSKYQSSDKGWACVAVFAHSFEPNMFWSPTFEVERDRSVEPMVIKLLDFYEDPLTINSSYTLRAADTELGQLWPTFQEVIKMLGRRLPAPPFSKDYLESREVVVYPNGELPIIREIGAHIY